MTRIWQRPVERRFGWLALVTGCTAGVIVSNIRPQWIGDAIAAALVVGSLVMVLARRVKR